MLDGAVFERSAFSNGRQYFALRSQSFFDNKPKQILSAIPDKNKQTVASSIKGCYVVVAVPLVSIFAQSTLPYWKICDLGLDTSLACLELLEFS